MTSRFIGQRMWLAAVLVILIGFVPVATLAQDVAPQRSAKDAVVLGLKLLDRSARDYPKHRKCFACHHQTFPLLASIEARAAEITVDEKLPSEITEFTRTYLNGRLDSIKDGKGIPGRAFMASYAAWTLRLGAEAQPNAEQARAVSEGNRELDRALVTYLVKTQEADGHWKPPSIRPPLEESLVTGTVLARSHLRRWRERLEDESDRQSVDAALQRSAEWLSQAKLERNEDVVFRLWGLLDDGAQSEQLQPVKELLQKQQRDDGGWAQQAGMSSDAYATGQALYVLIASGMAATDEPISKATAYLLKTQAADGSWFVPTRAKPIQEFFDNGDPYDKSQFISISATGWAVAALAKTVTAK